MKVYVGSIVWRQVDALHLADLVPLLTQPDVRYRPMVGDALVERARSISATRFLEDTDDDVFLSIDSDITHFRAGDVLKMCEQTYEHDIVGAVYMARDPDKTFPTSRLYVGQKIRFGNDPTPVEIEYLATGFVAVHRRVLEALRQDMPLLHPGTSAEFYPFYHTLFSEEKDGSPIMLSEDWSFCKRARDAGFKVCLNPAIRPSHIGTIDHRLEDVLARRPKLRVVDLTLVSKGKWSIESPQEELATV